MRRVTRALPPLLAVAAFACANAPPDGAGAEAELRAAREAVIAALNEDDSERIMAGLTDDHLTMAPGEPLIDDLRALRGWHDARIAAVDFDATFDSEELVLLGDWAFDRFTSRVAARSRSDGSSVDDDLKGVWIWRRGTDGRWRIARSIWNSDRSAGPGAARNETWRSDVESEIRQMDEQLVGLASEVDADRVNALIADDGEFLFNGARMTIPEAKRTIRDIYGRLRAQRFELSTPVITVLSADAALVSASGALSRVDSAGATAGPWPFAYTMLWTRAGQGWQIRASHQSSPMEES